MAGHVAMRWIGWAEMGTWLGQMQEELEGLNAQARELEATIATNGAGIQGGSRRTPRTRLGC